MGWTCSQRVLLTPGQYRKCTEYYVRQADGLIQDKISEWANNDVVPAIKQEIERLCDAIGDDARAVLEVLDEMSLEINAEPQLNDMAGAKPAALVERLMAAGVATLFGFPIVAMMGGLFGARQAVEQFTMQIAAAALMAVFGVLNLPLFLAAGGIIALINGFRNTQSSKGAIREKVIKKIQLQIREPSGEMEERLGDMTQQVFKEFSAGISQGIDIHLNNIQEKIKAAIDEKRRTEEEVQRQIEAESRQLEQAAALGKKIDGLAAKVNQMAEKTD
jgi:hypothetical protein